MIVDLTQSGPFSPELMATRKLAADLTAENANLKVELDRLRAENSELRRVLEDCANDLACHIEHHYRDTLDYPSQKRKYDLDMAPVHEARAILARTVPDPPKETE